MESESIPVSVMSPPSWSSSQWLCRATSGEGLLLRVGQQGDQRGRVTGLVELPQLRHPRKGQSTTLVAVAGQGDLFEVVLTLHASSGGANFLDGREK